MFTRSTFYVGTGFDAQGKAMAEGIVSAVIMPQAYALLAQHYEGFTALSAVGGWSNTTESAVRFEVVEWFDGLPDAIHRAKLVASELAKLFNQTAVLFTTEEVHAEMVGQKEHVL